jgi:hypothetical protein
MHLTHQDLRERERDGREEPPAPWVEEPEPDAIGEGDGVSVGVRG